MILVDPRTADSLTTILDHAILEALENQSFPSIRELAKFSCIPTAPVYRHLTQSLGFVVKHLHRVPHSLTVPQKSEHVTHSKGLLHQFLSIKHNGWQFILTLDESSFHFGTDHEHI
jgi:hypothetical protein